VVPHLTRVVREPVRIGGFDLVEGQRVAPSPWLAHHHPAWWPDPDRFDPARFERPPAPHTWFPFGLGARVCVGRPFVMLQMRVVLGTLLRVLPARLAEGWAPRPVRRLVLVVPDRGVPMERVSAP
ncbi:MAG: cytochrome P450, partial [Myxococcales bacterium]|nr:cytochrome P450 [Myxococcales bacterium]